MKERFTTSKYRYLEMTIENVFRCNFNDTYYHETVYIDNENGKNRSTVGFDENGLIMIDSVNTDYDNKVRHKWRSMLATGTRSNKNKYLVEDPIFVNSLNRQLSQLADCVAYCVKKRFRKDEPERMHDLFEEHYQRLSNRFFRGSRDPNEQDTVENYGIKIYPLNKE